ncbi:2-dehydropantoate 2-reductase [Salinimonas sp. HHU 13199]|uniref:2-dehydropantoate 2-reductase n=1 Tax=Salinimonas profundi TaxID=2729140 RepID=A0ABR8LG54_9ALTE|nr:2-dehydropantoate 2-reductase [Salinimonas profundi]MBD3585239.1 2-dehydropantoate 2-reductase [Salinimonas profundi]
MANPIRGQVHIVGSGAIGSLIAAGAQRNNIAYSLAPRSPEKLTQRITSYSNQSRWLSANLANKDSLGPDDLLILPLKVYQLEAAARQWQDRLDESTPILLLHNGMGGLEAVRRVLPEHAIYIATTSHGVLKTSRHEVRHTGFGRTIFGEAPDNQAIDDEQLERVFETVSRCLQPVTWHKNIMEALWFKLAINAVINPLTALHDIPNGDLSDSRFAGHINDISQETATVMQAEGFRCSVQDLVGQVMQVIRATSQNYSSMHQDVKHRRPTEIDAINGYIVQSAQKKGIDVPINAFLYKKIKALESTYS